MPHSFQRIPLDPAKADIEFASAIFREFLRIRKSSKLFRLETAEQIKDVVSFYNNGPEHIPDLIVMDLNDRNDVDPVYEEIVVLFNARPEEVTFSDSAFKAKKFVLNSIQEESSDERVRESNFDPASGTFTVPGRTTAVFNVLHEQPVQVTPTATEAASAIADPNILLTLIGVVGAFVAVLSMLFALRSKRP